LTLSLTKSWIDKPQEEGTANSIQFTPRIDTSHRLVKAMTDDMNLNGQTTTKEMTLHHIPHTPQKVTSDRNVINCSITQVDHVL
jgi:hypothetical protein